MIISTIRIVSNLFDGCLFLSCMDLLCKDRPWFLALLLHRCA